MGCIKYDIKTYEKCIYIPDNFDVYDVSESLRCVFSGTCTVRWENRTMNCIVNVFAIAIVL